MAESKPITSGDADSSGDDQGGFALAPPPMSKEEERRARRRTRARERLANDPEYRAKRRAKNRAVAKAWCEANPEIKRARDKAYRQANPEKRQAASKARYEANREKVSAQIKAYRQANPERTKRNHQRWVKANPEKNFAHKLKYKYKLTSDQYSKMQIAQDHRCLICRQRLNPAIRALCPQIDHCHKTGRVRGILCRSCNMLLGHAVDQPRLLRAAARYLERCAKQEVAS